jgi:hypothetical protein
MSDLSGYHVYVIAHEDHVFRPLKIGIARDPLDRQRTLQTGNSRKLFVILTLQCTRPVAEAIERSVHEAFAAKRVNGEWFDVDEDDAILKIHQIATELATFVEKPTLRYGDFVVDVATLGKGRELQYLDARALAAGVHA